MPRIWAKKNDAWAFVPGPKIADAPVDSCNISGPIPVYSDAAVASHAEKFSALRVTKLTVRDYSSWTAVIDEQRGRINLKMTLQSENEFGGFLFYGKFELQLIIDFWRHLRKRFNQILVFADDLNLYDERAFLKTFGG